MSCNKTPYGFQCHYVISIENSANNGIWSSPPPPPPSLARRPGSAGKQQICTLTLAFPRRASLRKCACVRVPEKCAIKR